MFVPKKRISRVFMDISVGGKNAGRLIFELFSDVLPITSENFRCLCTGETGLGYYNRPRWYKSSLFHRIIPNFMCHGGDYIKGNGYGGESIYGQNFRDEGFVYQHSQRGVLSMAKTLHRHSNNSQFFITFDSCPWLDNHHVVFGCLTEGMETLDAIEAQGTPFGRPQRLVSIWNCGEFSAFTLNRIAQNGLEKSNEDPLKENISETMKLPSTTSRPLINEEQFNLLRSREETGLPISLLKGSKFFL